MTNNFIEIDCPKCGNKVADVLCKLSFIVNNKTVQKIQVKCAVCFYNQFLDKNHKDCKRFFTDNSETDQTK